MNYFLSIFIILLTTIHVHASGVQKLEITYQDLDKYLDVQRPPESLVPMHFSPKQFEFENSHNIKNIEQATEKHPHYFWSGNVYQLSSSYPGFENDNREFIMLTFPTIKEAKEASYYSALNHTNLKKMQDYFFGKKVIVIESSSIDEAEFDCPNFNSSTFLFEKHPAFSCRMSFSIRVLEGTRIRNK